MHFCSVFSFFVQILMGILKVNSDDPDQTPQYAVSDLSLHCFTYVQ